MTLEEFEELRNGGEATETELSRAIYRTFITDDGKRTLLWILERCGFFASERQEIDPSLIAFVGDLMRAGKMGIGGNPKAFADALLKSYTGHKEAI